MKTIACALVAGALSVAVVHAQDSRAEKSELPKDPAFALSGKAERLADEITETLTPTADARKVPVKLTSERIEMPKRLPRGATAFIVQNIGREKVNFEVEGPRIAKRFRAALAPREQKVFQMTLRRGTYTVYCTAVNGKKTRIELNLTVR